MAGIKDYLALDLFAHLFPNLVEWKHPHVARFAKSASLSLKTEGQTDKNIQDIVAFMLKESGCGRCGRLAMIDLGFLVDPPEDLSKNGVIDAEMIGFAR
jgi:hypothetical protein